jgi:hypothetical protein
MAINVVTMTVPRKDRSGRTPFCLSFDSADLSGCETILLLPTGASGIYLESILLLSTASITVTVGDGDGGTAVTAAVIGPITFNRDVGTPDVEVAPAVMFEYKFKREILFGTSIAIDASGAGVVNGVVEGYSA